MLIPKYREIKMWTGSEKVTSGYFEDQKPKLINFSKGQSINKHVMSGNCILQNTTQISDEVIYIIYINEIKVSLNNF